MPNLKNFSLIGTIETWFYNETILPILHRMSNLERLFLSVIIDHEEFLDGNRLNNDIVNHLAKLNEFEYNIYSRIYDYQENDIRSNEDIQHTFQIFGDQQTISCVDYFPKENFSQCHYYSYPYRMTIYENITNHFPGGLFVCVREISLFDERPFEHRFFLRLSKAFPYFRKLTIDNLKAQNEKSSPCDNEGFPIIEYLSMTELCLFNAHDDYIEQFLLNSKSFIPNYFSISIHYHSLERVTNYFIRDETRMNSAKIKHMFLSNRHHFSNDFKRYFSSLQTYCFSLRSLNSN